MNRSQIRKEIATLINSIKEHSDNIGHNEHIPQLELELILLKIEKLYQKSIVFNHLNSLPNNDYPIKETAIVPKEKSIINEPEVKPSELKITPVDLFGTQVNPVTEKAKPEKKQEKKEEIAPAHKLQKPTITDLRTVIGINDKFQFSNELFGGNMQEYEIALQQLNTAETLESAMDYYLSLQQLYNWDLKSEITKRLVDIIERRYS